MSVRRMASVVVLTGLVLVAGACTAPSGSRSTLTDTHASEIDPGLLPLTIVENQGQVDPRAPYYLHGAGTSVYFTRRGLRLSLEDTRGTTQRWNLALDFVGADPTAPSALAQSPAVVSYFEGRPEDWHTDLRTYTEVAYLDLWPGIDLVYRGIAGKLKYSFLISPGADPSVIRLDWRGATDVRVDRTGQIEVSTPAGKVTDERPVSFQRVGGHRVEVPTSYVVGAEGYGFRLGSYDRSRPLVIDPAMLLYAGYIGGSDEDLGSGIAVDATGAAYITGQTSSTQASFPHTVGPDLTYNGGSSDAFVAKVDPSGTSLLYAGYIGGSGTTEFGSGIAVDGAGAAYVTGVTSSTEATFPVAVGPDLTYNGGVADRFVAKVTPDGTGLAYAGYIGGAGTDSGQGIAVDAAGAAYLAGFTSSTQASFPVAGGPDLTYNGGLTDAFVAKVEASGATLNYAGYIGGSGDDSGSGVGVDGAGNAFVAGSTDSTQASFPVTGGPDLTYNGGSSDAFVAEVASSGASLSYAGYIGGDGADGALDVAADTAGAAYLTGQTGSTETTFPVTVGPDLTYGGAGLDAFVAKVAIGGSSLSYAGYVGGSAIDFANDVDLDPTGAAYVTGRTSSTEATFPVAVGPDLTQNGMADAFVARVLPSGASFSYAGYIGGSEADQGGGIAVDRAGNAYVAGDTFSTEATFPVKAGPDLSYNGSGPFFGDAFVAKVETAETCQGTPVTILGSDGPDVLTGTSGPDVVLALGADDTISTLGGADLVCAGSGDDTVATEGEADTILGGTGNDTIRSGSGNDLLLGEDDNDKLLGQGGKDRLKGSGGRDLLKGGSGNDRLAGQKGKDKLKGQGGRDRLNGGPGRDFCAQGAGTGPARKCETGPSA